MRDHACLRPFAHFPCESGCPAEPIFAQEDGRAVIDGRLMAPHYDAVRLMIDEYENRQRAENAESQIEQHEAKGGGAF